MREEDIFDKVADMFALRDCEEPGSVVAFKGLLSPTENYVQPYRCAALIVKGRILKDPETKNEHLSHRFHGSFLSLDDSGLAFLGPWEGEVGATKRYQSFEAFIREHHPMMPTLEQVKTWSKRNGVHPDLY